MRLHLIALAVAAAAPAALAQSNPTTTPSTSSTKGTPSSSTTQAPAASVPGEAVKLSDRDLIRKEISDELRKEMEARLEKAKEEMRDEVRAQLATQAASKAWDNEWQEEKRKLELVELDGYLRLRPVLLDHYDLGRGTDPWGYNIFPAPFQVTRNTQAGADMRFRLEPTLNVSEDIRIRAQIDILDNLVLGSTPLGAGGGSQTTPFTFLSTTQVPPIQGVNSPTSAIALKRLWGEINTQYGVLRFGRMGSHWGMGVVTNDGECLDCDHGDTVDRVMWVLKVPFLADNLYVVPMFDFIATGPTTAMRGGPTGEVYTQDNGSNALSFDLAVAFRDNDKELQKKLDAGQTVVNGGIYATFKTQTNDAASWNAGVCNNSNCSNYPYGNITPTQAGWLTRNAYAVTPDGWFRLQQKDLRVEVEAAMVIGQIGSYANQPQIGPQTLSMLQYGGAAQGEYKLLDGSLSVLVEIGMASGTRYSWGMGSLPGRMGIPGSPGYLTNGTTPVPGIINGPSYYCTPTGCPEGQVNGFLFNADYRIDNILWRDLYEQVTGAMYGKLKLSYEITTGLSIWGAAIYSRAEFVENTPSASCGTTGGLAAYDASKLRCAPGQTLVGDTNLGVELNVGASYLSDDGFFLGLTWAILFPLGGLTNNFGPTPVGASTAQGVRGMVGVKF
jgi:uncharacterized protein (TIGR04551 family)